MYPLACLSRFPARQRRGGPWVAALLLGMVPGVPAWPAEADIKIGVVVSATGPAASLGIPEKNTIALLPQKVAGRAVHYIVLDDATDTSRAVQNTRKLIDEDKVDAIIGSTITPNSMGMIELAAQNRTPMISLAAAAVIVLPVDEKRHWVFKTPPNDALMAGRIAADLAQRKLKTLGFIGFADSYGESWQKEMSAAATTHGFRLVADERYNRTDTSVTGQILKILATKPDAILIGASGTPAALPAQALKERGYAGQVYQTHGVANNDFLRVCGKACEGQVLPAAPLLVVDQLPDSNPVKHSALIYRNAYEKIHGAESLSTFGGHAWDAGQLLVHAIPLALKKGEPGTAGFRAALRDAIETTRDFPVSNGIITMGATEHNGFDARARVLVQIRDGKWKLAE